VTAGNSVDKRVLEAELAILLMEEEELSQKRRKLRIEIS
jgi:hypothetical protein